MLSDRSMVAFAHFVGGWERVAYEFGCKAIHLSDLHAYQAGDPMKNLSEHDRQEIAQYLSSYHHYDGKDLTMDDMVSYLPHVMEKDQQQCGVLSGGTGRALCAWRLNLSAHNLFGLNQH